MIEVNFKFEIGQFVYIRQELRRWHDRYGRLDTAKDRGYQTMGDIAVLEHRPSVLQIIERHLQQCYGGIQLHYHLRAGDRLLPLTEAELTADFNDPSCLVADGVQ